MGEWLPGIIWDAWRTKRGGPTAIASRQGQRLAHMVTFARKHSAFYRELYRDLPQEICDTALLPVTNKKSLMAHFDDWVTDPNATREKVRTFVGDSALVGELFLGKYTALTTSGTTGTPGLFIWDDRTMGVINTLALRMLGSWLNASDVFRVLVRGGRMSMVMGTGGHFASAVAAARLCKRRGKRMQALSVHTPLPELVARLNSFRPVLVAPYASMAKLLAGEQEAGRLKIEPVLVVLSAEGLPAGDYDRIGKAFNAKVGNSYAATECPFLSYSCKHGWLHVNSDWAVLEPVDANYQPTPPGELSHTVLISNLANLVQPILRYDIGDSVVQKPDPCPCGNPLMAIRVQGRTADLLTFPNQRGERISIAPLALEVNELPGLQMAQIVQTTPTNLRVRLLAERDTDPDRVWESLRCKVEQVLEGHMLGNVTIERAEEPPEQSSGGKFRTVIPLN